MRNRAKFPVPGLLGLAATVLALLAAPPAQAATITADTTVDETGNAGQCSLRDAIAAADTDSVHGGCSAGSGTDTISLPAGSFVLTNGELQLTSSATIAGAGAASTTIDADHASRILEIGTAGGNALNANIGAVTLTGGRAPAGVDGINNGASSVVPTPGGSGGAILDNTGILTVTDSVLSDDRAGDGGEGGSSPLIAGGQAGASGGNGGAIAAGAPLTLARDTFTANAAGAGGAGAVGGLGFGMQNGGPGGEGGPGGSGGAVWTNQSGKLELTGDIFGGSAAAANRAGDGGPGNAGGGPGGGINTHAGADSDGGTGGSGGSIAAVGDVEMTGGSITFGHAGAGGVGGGSEGAGGAGGSGGAISDSGGDVTVSGVTLSSDAAGNGGVGAAHGAGGSGGAGGAVDTQGFTQPVTASNAVFASDSAGAGGSGVTGGGGGSGGAVFASTAHLSFSDFSTDAAGNGGLGTGEGGAGGSGGGGGAFWASGFGSNTVVASSSFEDDTAGSGAAGGSGMAGSGGSGGSGGALAFPHDSEISISASTFSADAAGGAGQAHTAGQPGTGAAIDDASEFSTTLVNDTFTGSPATGAAAPALTLSGSLVFPSERTLTNVTIARNGAKALVSTDAHTTTTISNSLLAENGGTECSGLLTNGGHDLVFPQDSSCPAGFASADPKLAALGDNGGPTPTMALLAGSASIDQIPAASCPDKDQRGVSRPQGSACDIGAYEFTTLPSVSIVAPADGATFAQGQVVPAIFTCTASSPTFGLSGCAGTVANGQPIDTATPGSKSFSVTATDTIGESVVQTVHYTVVAPGGPPNAKPPARTSCVVPKLAGKKLKVARKKLAAGDCKLGKVTERNGVSRGSGKVVKQKPKPGKILAAGAKVSVKLG